MNLDTNKLQTLMAHVDTMNDHFKRCNGIINNDTLAWEAIYHDPALTDSILMDWIDVMKAFRLMDSTVVSYGQNRVFEELEKFLHANWGKNNGRCFDKGRGKGVSKPAFKALMEMKDIINEITGYVAPKPPPPIEPLTPFENLFDIE